MGKKQGMSESRPEVVGAAPPVPALDDGIRIGGVVCLNSGGPRMTVVEIDAEDVGVTWIPDNGSGHFSIATLPRACVRVMP